MEEVAAAAEEGEAEGVVAGAEANRGDNAIAVGDMDTLPLTAAQSYHPMMHLPLRQLRGQLRYPRHPPGAPHQLEVLIMPLALGPRRQLM